MRLSHLDHVGATTSIVCAIHCAISPLVLPLLPLVGGRIVGPGLEWIFTIASLIIGITSLAHSYRAVHRRPRAIVLFTVGFATLGGTRLLSLDGAPELTLILIAATLIVAAHATNVRLSQAARLGCHCACHAEDDSRYERSVATE